MFEDAILSSQSLISSNGDLYRNSGKSYTLAKLCNKYDEVVIYKNQWSVLGIENAGKKLDVINIFVPYRYGMELKPYKDKIFFIDENSGLSKDEIDELKKNHIVIGFI